jgi:hypothetical protein
VPLPPTKHLFSTPISPGLSMGTNLAPGQSCLYQEAAHDMKIWQIKTAWSFSDLLHRLHAQSGVRCPHSAETRHMVECSETTQQATPGHK